MGDLKHYDEIVDALKSGSAEGVEKALLLAITSSPAASASSSASGHPIKSIGSAADKGCSSARAGAATALPRPAASKLVVATRELLAPRSVSVFDVNAPVIGDRRATLLHIAAEFGSTDVLDVILRHGGDLDVVDDEGWTPLHYAAAAGSANVIVRSLEHCVISACVKENSVSSSPIIVVHGNDIDRRSLSPTNSSRVARRIYEFINSPDKFGQTPLHVAAEHSKGPCILALLHAGADRHAKDNSRRSAADLLRNAAMIAIMGNPHHAKRREFADSELGKDIEWVLTTGTSRRTAVDDAACPSAATGTTSPSLIINDAMASPKWSMSTSTSTLILEGLACAAADQHHHRHHHDEPPHRLRRTMINDSGRSSVDSVCDDAEGINDIILTVQSSPATAAAGGGTNGDGETHRYYSQLEAEVDELRREVADLQAAMMDLRVEMCREMAQAHANQQELLDRLDRDKREARESRKQIVVFFANEIDDLKNSKAGEK